MYHTRFRLREEPFGVTPDSRFFYENPGHCEAVATLFYAIQQRRGFALLVGRAGVGKTSVLLTLVGMLKGKAQIGYLGIRQRFSGIFNLEPLAGPEINEYIAYRLQTAGGSISLFSPEAIEMIASASGGVPRNINTICFNSLTLAFALDKDHADTDEIKEVLRDLDIPFGKVESRRPATLPARTRGSAQVDQSSRPGWVGAGVVLLAVCGSLLGARRKNGNGAGRIVGLRAATSDKPEESARHILRK